MINPWHIRIGKFGRSFVKAPTNIYQKFFLLKRSWRKYNELWWSKPSRNQHALDNKIICNIS